MKTKIYIILMLSFILCEDSSNQIILFNSAQELEKINNIDEALNIYIKLFNENNSSKKIYKKIKPILIDKGDYKTLISILIKHIDSLNDNNEKFLLDIDLLELQIWDKSNKWQTHLDYLFNEYIINETNSNFIIKKNRAKIITQKLSKNNLIHDSYNLIKKVRMHFKDQLNLSNEKINLSAKDTTFLSRDMISILSKNNLYKLAIDECFLFLKSNKNNFFKKTLKDEIFIFCDKILFDATNVNVSLPISNSQFESNLFFNFNLSKNYEMDEINYLIKIYEKMIANNFELNKSKFYLANIYYEIFSDLDSAYDIYYDIYSSNDDLKFNALIKICDIVVEKGQLEKALELIDESINIVYSYNSLNDNMIYKKLNFKKIEYLFYLGDYSLLLSELENQIKLYDLGDKELNDLLELKTILISFNQDKINFKNFANIQYKINMNKIFESYSDLNKLINSENILIAELTQFQYCLLEIKKGNFIDVKKIIESMNDKTIYTELSKILEIEIEDFIFNNYLDSMDLYENFLISYPNSIYKENIINRLNQIEKILNKDTDL
tara:strand:+ start:28753 stop:30408 length:1656 start_codon:yes stop_codon:yes gene_type:complete